MLSRGRGPPEGSDAAVRSAGAGRLALVGGLAVLLAVACLATAAFAAWFSLFHLGDQVARAAVSFRDAVAGRGSGNLAGGLVGRALPWLEPGSPGGPLLPVNLALEAIRTNPRLDPDTAWQIALAIHREAARNRLDPFLVASVIKQESRFDPAARGDAGEYGLMQVLPDTARLVARLLDLDELTAADLFDPDVNIAVGTRYLAWNLELMGRLARDPARATELALISYNRGTRRTLEELAAGRLVTDYSRAVLDHWTRMRVAYHQGGGE